MRYKVIAETVYGADECEKSAITLETNSTFRAGTFVRDLVWKFNERWSDSIIERVVSIEKDGVTEVFDEKDWDIKAIKWLEINDWY